jgi:hypothetical protein
MQEKAAASNRVSLNRKQLMVTGKYQKQKYV